VVLCPFDDPATSGYDWPEQVPQALAELKEAATSCPAGEVSYRSEETDHGLGLDWPTLTVDVLKVGALVVFGIPILHKKVRDTVAGWREIKATVDKAVGWLARKHPVLSYSMGKAYLEALAHLDAETDVLELELLTAVEVAGPTNHASRSFETSEVCHYLFAFRQGDERIFLVVYDSKLKLHLSTSVPLSL
jgi:hypothetical protein